MNSHFERDGIQFQREREMVHYCTYMMLISAYLSPNLRFGAKKNLNPRALPPGWQAPSLPSLKISFLVFNTVLSYFKYLF